MVHPERFDVLGGHLGLGSVFEGELSDTAEAPGRQLDGFGGEVGVDQGSGAAGENRDRVVFIDHQLGVPGRRLEVCPDRVQVGVDGHRVETKPELRGRRGEKLRPKRLRQLIHREGHRDLRIIPLEYDGARQELASLGQSPVDIFSGQPGGNGVDGEDGFLAVKGQEKIKYLCFEAGSIDPLPVRRVCRYRRGPLEVDPAVERHVHV